jgi:hypothetical protein
MKRHELQVDYLSVSGFSMQPNTYGNWVRYEDALSVKKKAFKDAIDFIQDNGWLDTYYTMSDKNIEDYSNRYLNNTL